jgi:hypothetical protein
VAEPARAAFAPTPTRPSAPRPANGGGTVARRSSAAVVVAKSPTTGAVPAVRPSGRRRPVSHRGGPSFLSRLAQLLRSGGTQAGQLTAEDWRVIAYLTVALLVASGAQIDLDAPAPVEVPPALPTTSVTAPAPAAPAGGGMVDDPTSDGRITQTAAHGLAEIRRHLAHTLRGVTCWSAHEWNPASDHPKGRACDVYTSPAGKFASGDGLVAGNGLVAWLRANHDQLRVSYVIWQGRIWSAEKGDRAYRSGTYDTGSAVGGHFDHIHISFQR